MCRQTPDLDHTRPNLIPTMIINEAEVFCSNDNCPWKDKLANLEKHLSSCQFDVKKLPKWLKTMNQGEPETPTENSKKKRKKKEEAIKLLLEEENPQTSNNDTIMNRLYSKDDARKLLKCNCHIQTLLEHDHSCLLLRQNCPKQDEGRTKEQNSIAPR
jgi:hypothetical protein